MASIDMPCLLMRKIYMYFWYVNLEVTNMTNLSNGLSYHAEALPILIILTNYLSWLDFGTFWYFYEKFIHDIESFCTS